jgi:hypothetical protein
MKRNGTDITSTEAKRQKRAPADGRKAFRDMSEEQRFEFLGWAFSEFPHDVIGRGHADYQEPAGCAQGFHPSIVLDSDLRDGGTTRVTCDECGDVVLAAKGMRLPLPQAGQ